MALGDIVLPPTLTNTNLESNSLITREMINRVRDGNNGAPSISLDAMRYRPDALNSLKHAHYDRIRAVLTEVEHISTIRLGIAQGNNNGSNSTGACVAISFLLISELMNGNPVDKDTVARIIGHEAAGHALAIRDRMITAGQIDTHGYCDLDEPISKQYMYDNEILSADEHIDTVYGDMFKDDIMKILRVLHSHAGNVGMSKYDDCYMPLVATTIVSSNDSSCVHTVIFFRRHAITIIKRGTSYSLIETVQQPEYENEGYIDVCKDLPTLYARLLAYAYYRVRYEPNPIMDRHFWAIAFGCKSNDSDSSNDQFDDDANDDSLDDDAPSPDNDADEDSKSMGPNDNDDEDSGASEDDDNNMDDDDSSYSGSSGSSVRSNQQVHHNEHSTPMNDGSKSSKPPEYDDSSSDGSDDDSRTSSSGDDSVPHTDVNGHPLSEYERDRLRKIQRNEARIKA